MAVVKVRHHRGPENRSQQAAPEKTAVEVYSVEVDDVNDTGPMAEAAIGVSRGDQLAGDPDRRCNLIRSNGDQKSQLLYWVYAEYSNKSDFGEAIVDPLSRPTTVDWDVDETSEPLYRDKDNNPIVNSAGDTFDPPVHEDYGDPVAIVTKNYPRGTIDANFVATYANAVNEDDVTAIGAAAGTCKIKGISSRGLTENGIEYEQAIFRIVLRANYTTPNGPISGWTKIVLDEGRYMKPLTISLAGGTETITVPHLPLVDLDGQPVTDPKKLNGAGLALSDENPAQPTNNFLASADGTAVFRLIFPIKTITYSGLNF